MKPIQIKLPARGKYTSTIRMGPGASVKLSERLSPSRLGDGVSSPLPVDGSAHKGGIRLPGAPVRTRNDDFLPIQGAATSLGRSKVL